MTVIGLNIFRSLFSTQILFKQDSLFPVLNDLILILFLIYQQHEVIWVSCEGENPADIENLGPINYIPERGFSGYYFPFLNQKNYLPPVLAINFERPKSK